MISSIPSPSQIYLIGSEDEEANLSLEEAANLVTEDVWAF